MLDPPTLYGESSAKTSTRSFVTTDRYSPNEILEILVDALILAVPTAHDVAQATLTQMQTFGPVQSLTLASELASRRPREVRLPDLDSRSAAVHRVEKLLRELKVELQDGTASDSSA